MSNPVISFGGLDMRTAEEKRLDAIFEDHCDGHPFGAVGIDDYEECPFCVEARELGKDVNGG